MVVYVALNSIPDYSASTPSLKSVHKSLAGAIKALYPDKDYEFKKWPGHRVWEGPDGFGMIREVELED